MKIKGQTWSFDLIVAVVLFVVVVGLFYGFIIKDKVGDNDVLVEEGKLIAYKLNCDNEDSNDLCVVSQGNIDESKLEDLYSLYDYEYIKDELNVKGDFCIYLSDLNGNLYPINDITGVGSSDLMLTQNYSCGELIPEEETGGTSEDSSE